MAMDGMDMSSSSSSSNMMSMVFTDDHTSPLYSSAWTPKTAGGYAGTCIFLVILAIIARCLHAYRAVVEAKWHDRAVNRRYIVVAGETAADRERQELSEKAEDATLTSRGLDESVRVVRTAREKFQSVPWRFSVDIPRACIYVVQAGVGYLLMLAVMTLNVGYFLSVLAGLFVGEVAVGRYTSIDDGHH